MAILKKISALLFFVMIPLTLLPQAATETQPSGAEAQQPAAAEAVVEDSSEDILNDQIYTELILEDFETTTYEKSNVSIRVTKDQQADVAIRDSFPAPVKDSKKYLGVKVFGRQGDFTTITFPKKLETDKHCQSVSVWVYGKKFAGELSIILQDADGKVHRLSFGKLNFLGWRKLTVKLTKDIAQEDKYLAQPRSIAILKMIYNPNNTARLGEWHYFYVDNISVKVRDKYQDRQSDSW